MLTTSARKGHTDSSTQEKILRPRISHIFGGSCRRRESKSACYAGEKK